MNPRKSKSNEPAKVTTYRITDHDRMILESEHGRLSDFLNAAVEKEVKRIERKKGVKPKITKS